MLLFAKNKHVITSVRSIDTTATVYNFTVSEFHTYYVSSLGILVHNASFKWQRTSVINDMITKGVHGNVMDGKLKIGEVGFELENGEIVPEAFGKNLSKDEIKTIEKIGAGQLKQASFLAELLVRVKDAISSGQIKIESDRYRKLVEMEKILTHKPVEKTK